MGIARKGAILFGWFYIITRFRRLTNVTNAIIINNRQILIFHIGK